MLEGKTHDGLAIANTAILPQLIEELIELSIITRPGARGLLRHAVDHLKNCPTADQSNIADAITIIHKELLPRISESVRAV
jgi:hypothetical protein